MSYTNSPMVAVAKISPHKTAGRTGDEISKYTIHHAAGVLSVESMLGWFQSAAAKSSSQYTVGGDGRVGMSVEEKDRAWTSSSGANDCKAVTVEVVNSSTGGQWPVSDRAYETVIALGADVCLRNPGIKQKDGKPGLYFDGTPGGSLTHHQMFAATGCPGPYLMERLSRVCDEVNKRLGAAADTIASAPPSGIVVVGNIYRVRKTWADAAGQIGAYQNMASAVSLAEANKSAGYKVYDTGGQVVYDPTAVAYVLPKKEDYQSIIQEACRFSHPQDVWAVIDTHRFALDLYAKWAATYNAAA